jgi:Toprim domain
VIINAESWRRQLTSQPSLLVALTRAVKHLTLYTDDKAALLQAVINNPGYKSSALEIMGEASPPGATFSASSAQPALPSKQVSRLATVSIHRENESSKLPTESRLDAHRISHLLTDQAEQVLERLLGEPKTKTGGQYRYGARQGSLVVTLAGDKRGLWHDFQTGEGGHLLKLIALQKNLDIQRDFQGVLREALVILGTSPADLSVQAITSATPQKPPVSMNRETPAPTPEQQRSLRYAQQLARESQPVVGTLAERYLREQRGIALDAFPDSVRFHPGIYSRKNEAAYPALLVVAKDSTDKVQAVQAIFLDAETARKADVPVKKQTWGQPSLGSVTLGQSSPSGATPKTYLAEGPETALSIFSALNGADVRITLGKSNFKNMDPATTQSHVVLCLDNDGQKPQSDRLIHFAAEKLQEQGKIVWIAQPKIEGWDYNDMLMHQGLAAVKKELQQAVSYSDYRDQIKPDIILQKEIPVDIEKKSPTEQALSVDKNPVIHPKSKPEKQPELEI